MKYFILATSLFLCCSAALAQEERSKPETFEMVWEGEPITMQKYFIIFLKKGPNRDQPEVQAKRLQADHLAYLGGLYKKGVLKLNGPVGDDSNIAGFSVYSTATLEEAIELAEGDPAVIAGRLVVEAHPWWLAQGSSVN